MEKLTLIEQKEMAEKEEIIVPKGTFDLEELEREWGKAGALIYRYSPQEELERSAKSNDTKDHPVFVKNKCFGGLWNT